MRILSAFILAMMVSACSEYPQTMGAGTDAPSYSGAKNGFVEKNWTPGDKVSWEAQLKSRSKGQDEYTR